MREGLDKDFAALMEATGAGLSSAALNELDQGSTALSNRMHTPSHTVTRHPHTDPSFIYRDPMSSYADVLVTVVVRQLRPLDIL